MSCTISVAEELPLDIVEHRAYADLELPNGKSSENYRSIWEQRYAYTAQVPTFAVPFSLIRLAQTLNSEAVIFSNPDDVIEHPAFAEIKRLGAAAFPYLLKRMEHDPYVWLLAMPALAGESPVRPEHRGRTAEMVSDWKRWGIARKYL
jgi:hypothetical protein